MKQLYSHDGFANKLYNQDKTPQAFVKLEYDNFMPDPKRPELAFRGDSRGPFPIFWEGFHPRGPEHPTSLAGKKWYNEGKSVQWRTWTCDVVPNTTVCLTPIFDFAAVCPINMISNIWVYVVRVPVEGVFDTHLLQSSTANLDHKYSDQKKSALAKLDAKEIAVSSIKPENILIAFEITRRQKVKSDPLGGGTYVVLNHIVNRRGGNNVAGNDAETQSLASEFGSTRILPQINNEKTQNLGVTTT